MFVKDPEDDFRYLYWNKAFASHSKIPASKALGRTDFEVFPEYENAEKFHRDDLELIRTRERMEMQETYVTATRRAPYCADLENVGSSGREDTAHYRYFMGYYQYTEYRAGIDIRPYQSRTVRQVENRFPCQYEP